MSDLAQPLQQQQQSQRRRQRNGRAPKYPSSNGDQTFAQSNNRRIYDLRRWHRHKSADKLGACQPPAGWVLVWAGRFKRWRRRWFVAHPPGLLLYYKNSDQLGRSGCINLLGAEVAPSAGKERQLKIRKGARVYYLRTLNKENRQAWLDAISKSIRTYENSFQKAAVGSKSGALISFHQSMPSHLVEEWEAQERELNRRLARRMREIDPMRQAFLQQLQTLQHSLGVISGALGFTSQSGMGGTASVAAISANHVETGPGVGMVGTPRPSLSDLDTSSQKVDGSLLPVVKIQGSSSSHNNNATAPTHGRSTDRDCQVKLISSLSEPIPSNYIEKRVTAVEGQRCQSQQSTAEDTFSSPEYELLHEQGSCIGREFFRRRRRQPVGVNPLEKGHSSDTEVWSSSSSKRPSLSNKDVNGKNKYVQAELHPSCSVDRFSTKYATGILVKENGNANALGGSVQNSNRQRGPSCNGCKGISSGTMSSSPSSNSTIYPIQGPLHAAWNTMQDAFAEILKEEIHRVMELEAENAVLQQSLVMLPQLQQDHKDLLDLREQMQLQRDNICTANTTDAERDVDGEDGDDEETDDEVSVVHSEVTNEDYYEALEVLNQHDFIAKATSPEELEVLAERAECTQDPPEESDILVDAENSEAEGEDYELPRTRSSFIAINCPDPMINSCFVHFMKFIAVKLGTFYRKRDPRTLVSPNDS